MKTILVPFDFSQPSIEALKFAVILSEKNKARIELIHAVELPVLYESSVAMTFEQEYMKNQKSTALKKLNNEIERWATGNDRVTADVQFGGIVPVIEQTIKDRKASLVVMGTHGASGIKEYTIGSNTEKVVRNSYVPVIAVRKAVKTINHIVFPTFPEGDQEDITMQVKDLQNFFRAKVHVLYVNTPGLFNRDSDTRPKLDAFARRYMFKDYTINIYNDIGQAEGIINFTGQFKDVMVAMGTHGRLGITHLALGSVAEDVVNHIECPIWTLKVK
jgi:nucleotide-binding universal stress UspA family protein